jgi:hypothetical protein
MTIFDYDVFAAVTKRNARRENGPTGSAISWNIDSNHIKMPCAGAENALPFA